jgi:hypothetical protein
LFVVEPPWSQALIPVLGGDKAEWRTYRIEWMREPHYSWPWPELSKGTFIWRGTVELLTSNYESSYQRHLLPYQYIKDLIDIELFPHPMPGGSRQRQCKCVSAFPVISTIIDLVKS